MLSNLLESRRARTRPDMGAVMSAATHAALVILAINASGVAEPLPPAAEMVDLIYPRVPAPVAEAPRRRTPARRWHDQEGGIVHAPPVPPIDFLVPTELPAPGITIDLDAEEFGGSSEPTRTAGPRDGTPYNSGVQSAGTVERVAVPLPENPAPEYPAGLRAAGIDGYVLARFIVDTTGRTASGSLRIVESSGEAFSASVRRVLPRLRFEPARVGARKVRMLVEQSYVFRIER